MMKKIVWLFVAVLAMVACKKEAVDYAVFSGKIENAQGLNELVVKGNNISQKIEVKEDGSFSDTIRPVKSGYYALQIGRGSLPIYLEAGENLKLNMDFTNQEKPLDFVEGKSVVVNNYLQAKQKEIGNIFAKRGGFKGLFSLEEDDFLKNLEEIKQEQLKLIEANKDLPKEVVELEKKDAEYSYLQNLSFYPEYYVYLSKKEDYEPSEKITAPVNSIDYTIAEDYDQIASYKALVITHFMNKYMKDDADKNAVIEEVKKTGIQSLQNDFAEGLVQSMSLGSKDLDNTASQIHSLTQDENIIAALNTFMEKAEKLGLGKPSPTFTYTDIKGKEVSLKSLKGKLVYIDVWATWCGPCKGELPYLQQLEKDYHRKGITFVSISVDKEKTAWETMVKEKKLGGIQLFSDKNWSSDFVRAYDINGIPRFILLDKEGNIISADAPRPSSDEIRTLIDEWLKK